MSYESFEVLNDVDMRGMSGFCVPRVICVILLLTGGERSSSQVWEGIMADKNKNSSKCSVCACELIPWDHHLACLKCRNDKKGKDKCVLGKESDCLICAGATKSDPKKKGKSKKSLEPFDDSLLDDPNPSPAAAASTDSSLQALLKSMSSQIASLSSQFEKFQEKDQSSTQRASVNSDKEQGLRAPESHSRPDQSMRASASQARPDLGKRSTPMRNDQGRRAPASQSSQSRDDFSEGEVSEDEIASKRHRSSSPQQEPDRAQELDPSYVEMLSAIRNLLDLEVPEVECLVPPSAFSRKPSRQVVRKQNLALPPVQDIKNMWEFRFKKASGSAQNTDSLAQSQFLQFERPDMIYYTTSPQEGTNRAPKVPDSFYNISKVKTLSASIQTPVKQHLVQETVCRENIQILGHVVWFKLALEELSNRVQTLSEEIQESDDLAAIKDSASLISRFCQLQSSITSSMDIALDTVLKQNMTLACNLLLCRRDNLLKDCNSKLGPKDLATLRTGPFDQQEVFDSHVLSEVEDNLIKRMSILKESENKQYKDSNRSYDYGKSFNKSAQNDSKQPFRGDKRTQSSRSSHSARASYRGNKGGRGNRGK